MMVLDRLCKSLARRVDWRRHGGYEVSTKGDKRFSAFNAIMPDGRSIEMHYQCDVKGYYPGGKNWRMGKGKPPISNMSKEDLVAAYTNLWRIWSTAHKKEIKELRREVYNSGNIISDRFATTNVNQAAALATILNEQAIGLRIYTAHISVAKKHLDRNILDITMKSSNDKGKPFMPTRDLVYQYKYKGMTNNEYEQHYWAMMRDSYINNREAWDELLGMDEVILLCYCRAGEFCHRLCLTEILVKGWGAIYMGELTN